MSNVKNIAFTFISIILVPLLFFAVLELALLAAGVGQSFDYFRKIDIDGQTFFQENPDFVDQFYPQSLDIRPRENTFAAKRASESIRVYILGGSAALGFPHENHGLDRLLDAQLRAAFPSQDIEIINTAITSVNSHVVYAVANSIPDGSADYAVILMGNNEVVGPYGPGTLNQNFLGNLSVIRSLQALKRTRTWQALAELISILQTSDARQELEWQGMQMFSERGILHDDPRMENVYSHYNDNLTRIISTLQDKEIHVILSSVPVNLRHSAPFLSLHKPDMSDEMLDQWRDRTRQGAAAADGKNQEDAVKYFESALEIDPGYADTHFRLATTLENLGDFQTARTHYLHSLDLDALRFRADTKINAVVHEVADRAEPEGFSFVDSAAAFERASEPNEPGWNLFLEHVHYTFSGNHLLAAEISGAIAGNRLNSDSYQPLPEREIARRVGFPNYDTYTEIQTLQEMVRNPPFPGQSNYAELESTLNSALSRVTRTVGAPEQVIRKREQVAASGNADWKIHFELAVLHERLGNTTAMYQNLNRILELYPHNRETYMRLAEAKSNEGKWQEVIENLERSLLYTRGDESKVAETLAWLGVAHLRRADFETGTELLLEVTEDYPDQVVPVLRSYGQLVGLARKRGERANLERYIRDLQRYGRSVVQSGRAEEFPMLSQRMAQILSLGGYEEEAREWSKASPQ